MRAKIDDNELQQKVQDKLKYCVKTWTNNKPMLTAIKIPEGFHANSVRLLQEGNKRSISLEYSSEKNIELDIDDKNHWAPRCVSAGTLSMSNNNLDDFLNKTENATFAFFTVKVKEIRGIYMMAILNDIVVSRLRLV
jgi:putative sterol carrier protein